MEIQLETGRGIFSVLANVCGSPLEALRQFVENAADAIEQAGRGQGKVSLHLLRDEQGNLRELVLEDNGVGIAPDRMVQILHNIGDSDKVNLALRGEKGIGILAFALIAREVHLNSCAEADTESRCVAIRQESLREGKGEVLAHCALHSRREQGTTVHLMGILPESATYFAAKRIKEYLGREFTSDLRRKLYALTLVDGSRVEQVEPSRYRGLPLLAQTLPLRSFGHASLELNLLLVDAPDAAVSLYGRGGIRICSIADIETFQRLPWQDHQLEGSIRCDLLKLTANKTAVVQDKVFWELVAVLRGVEPYLKQEMARATNEHLQRRLSRVLRKVDFLVDRFVRYLEEGVPLRAPVARVPHENGKTYSSQGVTRSTPAVHSTPARALHFELYEPGEDKSNWRSWPNGGEELIRVNKEHMDFLEAEADDARCARYLFALWAKEHLLRDYGSDARRVADELVGWLNKADPLLGRAARR
ncbi:MAG: ATP-binding protein [Chloroflexi bacterium]|nr:ATP-binding protein [Chloroflexota bacterium]